MEVSVTQRIAEAIHAYDTEHGCLPQRITVSQEVAIKLDAAMAAMEEKFDASLKERPQLATNGVAVWFHGVLVVAELAARRIVDVR